MMKQNSGMQYDVFINHRGSDVKNSLASLIYNQLKTKNPTLRVFLDIKEIPCGVDFSYAIETAIQSSSVHICIFSEGYAESKWCLHELDLIIKSKRKLIPVFCDVNPASLRRIEKGCYQKAFEKHRGREPVEKTKRWEDALARASYLQGLTFKMKESDYWEFMEKIVSIVLMHLKDGSSVDDKYPVTPEQAVEEFPASATEWEDLGVCQEFITEKFALARGLDDDRLDLSEPSGADGPAVSELFEDEDGLAISKLFEPDEDGLAISKLFEPDDDGPAIGLDVDRPDVSELSGMDGPAASDLFEDEDGLGTNKLFEQDDDGPAIGLDDDRPDVSELSGVDGSAASDLFEDEDGLAISKLFEQDDDGLAISKLFEPDEDGSAISKLFEPDDDGPAIGLDVDRPDVSERSGMDGPAVKRFVLKFKLCL